MTAVADNTFILKTRDGRPIVYHEKSSGLIQAVLVDEAGQLIQASQLSSLKLWLHLRDDPAVPSGGINSVSDLSILNDGARVSIGNAKTITGAAINTTDDDFRGRIRLTIANHGYGKGDLVGVRDVRGLKGANGDWYVTPIDVHTIELDGSSGSGVWTSGGTAVKGLHLVLQANDNAIVGTTAIGKTEWHEAQVVAVASGKQTPFLFHFQVTNLGKIA